MNHSLQRDRIRPALLCCGALLITVLSACGQRGPLYLPEDPATESAPAEQQVEDGQESTAEDENNEEDGGGR